jgi:hypothetical protein
LFSRFVNYASALPQLDRCVSPAALIGYVEASDAEQAIQAAIREFGITNPEHQKRLVAQRTESGRAEDIEFLSSLYPPRGQNIPVRPLE